MLKFYRVKQTVRDETAGMELIAGQVFALDDEPNMEVFEEYSIPVSRTSTAHLDTAEAAGYLQAVDDIVGYLDTHDTRFMTKRGLIDAIQVRFGRSRR